MKPIVFVKIFITFENNRFQRLAMPKAKGWALANKLASMVSMYTCAASSIFPPAHKPLAMLINAAILQEAKLQVLNNQRRYHEAACSHTMNESTLKEGAGRAYCGFHARSEIEHQPAQWAKQSALALTSDRT